MAPSQESRATNGYIMHLARSSRDILLTCPGMYVPTTSVVLTRMVLISTILIRPALARPAAVTTQCHLGSVTAAGFPHVAYMRPRPDRNPLRLCDFCLFGFAHKHFCMSLPIWGAPPKDMLGGTTAILIQHVLSAYGPANVIIIWQV